MVMVEYTYGHKYRYDGVSENYCTACEYREGRFCKQPLAPNEKEPPFCEGGPHPTL